jgi:hypothetical protein
MMRLALEGLSFRRVVNSTKIKSVSVQTQLSSIHYVELHVSTYIRLSLGS